jgi:hypothetical protein
VPPYAAGGIDSKGGATLSYSHLEQTAGVRDRRWATIPERIIVEVAEAEDALPAPVSDADRELAFANLKKAARHFNVEFAESSWHEFGTKRATRH